MIDCIKNYLEVLALPTAKPVMPFWQLDYRRCRADRNASPPAETVNLQYVVKATLIKLIARVRFGIAFAHCRLRHGRNLPNRGDEALLSADCR